MNQNGCFDYYFLQCRSFSDSYYNDLPVEHTLNAEMDRMEKLWSKKVFLPPITAQETLKIMDKNRLPEFHFLWTRTSYLNVSFIEPTCVYL